jgi:hypothetical protein
MLFNVGFGLGQVAAGASLSDPRTFQTCPDYATVRATRGRLSVLSVFLCKSVLYGAFVWARRALNRRKRRFSAPRAAACLVHYPLTIAKVTSPRFTILFSAWAEHRRRGHLQALGPAGLAGGAPDVRRPRPPARGRLGRGPSVIHSPSPFPFVRRIPVDAARAGGE